MIDRPRQEAVLALVVAATLAAPPALDAGPGAAGRGPRPARTARPDPAHADEMVVVWYRLDDPLETFRYRIYDVRKGEYTPAVDDWIDLMHRRFPQYEARALPVDLAREEGATDKLKVGSVIRRELLLAAARSGLVLGAPIPTRPATETPPSHPLARPEAPGAGGSTAINPVTPPIPFPMPYVRPHP